MRTIDDYIEKLESSRVDCLSQFIAMSPSTKQMLDQQFDRHLKIYRGYKLLEYDKVPDCSYLLLIEREIHKNRSEMSDL